MGQPRLGILLHGLADRIGIFSPSAGGLMITSLFIDLKATLEYLGGVTDQLPVYWLRWMQSPIWWGIWWATLILLTLLFSGQTSKFIYIDF